MVAAAVAGRRRRAHAHARARSPPSSAGAALIALFNVALRGSRRALIATTALGLTTAAIYSLIYPDPELPFAVEVALSC